MTTTSTSTGAPRSTPAAVRAGAGRDEVAQRQPGGLALAAARPARCSPPGRRADQLRVRRRRRRPARPARPRSPASAPECRSRWPVGELGQLADAAGDGQPRHRVAAQVLQHRAGEVAHVQQRVLGQAVERLRRSARDVQPVQPATWVCPAARATSMPRRIESIQAEHEYGTTTPGRAEDRQPAEDAQPRVPGAAGPAPRRARPRPRRRRRRCRRAAAATAATCSRMIRRGTGLIAGSPTASGRPGLVTVPTPGPARKTTPLPGSPRRTVGRDQRAVGDVRVVAGVLDDAGGRRRRRPAPRGPARRPGAGRWGRSICTGSGNSPVSSAV